MLGHHVDFGYEEAVQLISSSNLSEKQTGQIACGILESQAGEDMLAHALDSIHLDLKSGDEKKQCFALTMIGNLNSEVFARTQINTVKRMISGHEFTRLVLVKKKAVVTLMRLLQKTPEMAQDCNLERIVGALIKEKNIGLLLAAGSLATWMIDNVGMDSLVPLTSDFINALNRMVMSRDVPSDQLYYLTPSPWCQVKFLRILSELPMSTNETDIGQLVSILNEYMNKTTITKNSNKNNADYSILFEALGVMLKYRDRMDQQLQDKAFGQLGRFLGIREPNIRQLGLEWMSKVASALGHNKIKQQLSTIQLSLKDPDISIRKRAVELLFTVCHEDIAQEVVDNFVGHLEESFVPMREEIILKTAILAERYALTQTWYVDIILGLIDKAGEYVSDEISYRMIQVVTGFGENTNSELQIYACEKIFKSLKSTAMVHEKIILIAS